MEGYWYNLFWATFGNIVGGAFFVAGMYWMGSPKAWGRKLAENAEAAPVREELELATV